MSQSFKEFGLRYIEEMAKEREHSKKEVSINILNLKHSQFDAAREITYPDFENFVESTRNQVIRIFDGELTKLTIKSLGKMRQLLTGKADGLNLEDDEVSKSELEKALKDVIYYSEQLEKIKKDKANERADFELIFEQQKTEIRELTDKIDELSLTEKKLYSHIQSVEEQFTKTNEQLADALKEVNIKNLTLEKLIEQNKLKEDDLQLITENMDSMLTSTEEQHKKEVTDIQERTRNELRFEYDLTVNDLENKLERERNLVSESEKKYKELEATHQEFVEHNLILKKDYAELKDRVDYGRKTLNFIESLLSTHPLYSSVMILANLGGTMPLNTLAKSVGAAPLRLRHLLDELVERKLIEIGEGENPKVTIVRGY